MSGVIPSQGIRELIDQKVIVCDEAIEDGQVQPSSIDLRLGKLAYRVPASFVMSSGGTVLSRLQEWQSDYYTLDLSDGSFLEAGKTYVIELQEQVQLPENMFARSNPKSSTGRVDTFTRVITDHCTNFDSIAAGYKGSLYLIVHPISFDVIVRTGLSLNQIRFFEDDDHRLAGDELRSAYDEHTFLFDDGGSAIGFAEAHTDKDGIYMSIDLGDDIVGFKSKKNARPIDLSRKNYLEVEDFWEPIHRPAGGRLILDPFFFYILKSKERIRVPDLFAVEMIDFHSGLGEFRTHYAGFFDPGFGFGKEGEVKGSFAVLEVRMRDTPMEVEDGQIVAKMVYEKMKERPDILYGTDLKSNYQQQGLKLSKHFKS